MVGRPTEVLDAILMFYKTAADSDAMQLGGELWANDAYDSQHRRRGGALVSVDLEPAIKLYDRVFFSSRSLLQITWFIFVNFEHVAVTVDYRRGCRYSREKTTVSLNWSGMDLLMSSEEAFFYGRTQTMVKRSVNMKMICLD